VGQLPAPADLLERRLGGIEIAEELLHPSPAVGQGRQRCGAAG
jgi:hypothetical protein